MISIDDHPPSDPSSSHDDHQEEQLSHDLKVSDLDLKFSDAYLDDTNNLLPNFSIRDYVFGIRNKDIACSWPFSPTSLQLCLKHGVKNLLPPFQSIDSLRNNSSLTRYSLENRLTDEKLITSFDGKPKNDQFSLSEQMALGSVTTKSSASIGDQESQFHLQHQTKSKEKDKPQKRENISSIRTIIKKSRFVANLNSGVEHAAPNSETMTSKVCPVCKVFSSSSNTTLNSHIDQCLTGEGTMKWTENTKVNVVVKHRVKPRKMRLMVDIYKTAPHCTIEELDKRNGTSWATNSSFPAQEFEFQDEEVEEKEEEEPKRTTINPEVANNEGDVYIDTDGTKVRILSVPKAGSSNNYGGRKLLKEVKRSKIIMGKKKKNVVKKKHYHKYLKLSPSARTICPSKPQATSGQEDDVAMKVADVGNIKPPWACSKRTGLSKKSSGKNQMNDLVFESEKSSSKCDLGTPQSPSDNVDCLQNIKKLRISLSLIKQPNNGMVFRKEATRMHDVDDNDDDDDDDDDDECPSQHSDYGADTGSKGSRFPYLSKNLSLPAPKFNLKRKFPAVEKFHVKSVYGSSQDSLKEQSRMEEQVDTKKKEDTRSISSKSSNGDSSLGIQTVNQDEFHDGESVRNETLLSNVPRFMGLSTSFNPEFSKQECDDLYQDQICSTNRAANDVEILESYCQEVDPIPIPGPPGSFLPASPGGEMVSEEEIQPVMVLSSSENQHHHDHTMDRDFMSNSPVSTVSNSRSTSVQDDTCKKPFLISDMGFTEKGLSHSSFKNNHQPCCCSRKEVALTYQDSYVLRKQPIAGFNFKSEMFSPATETVSFPTNKKFAVSSDCDSPASSPSKPVLRLMGKNLTVVKSDEDEFRPPQSSQQPVIFSQYQNGFQSQHFNVHPPINMRSPVDSMPIHGGYGHGGPYLGPSMPQTRSHHGHNVVDFQTISGRNVYNAVSSSKPINETIIIDDSPEKGADDYMRNDFFKRNQEQMNPSYTMFLSYGGGGGGSGGGFQTSLGNEDFGKWNIRSPSLSHLRSSTSYYPPNYL